MRKKEIDDIVNSLFEENWHGESIAEFTQKFSCKYSHDQIERIRSRYLYLKKRLEVSSEHEKDMPE